MTKLFVAYGRQDKEFVARVVDDLEQSGFEVFWDDRLLSGGPWREALSQRICECDHIVCVLSQQSVNSQEIAREHEIANTANLPTHVFQLEAVDVQSAPAGLMAYTWLSTVTQLIKSIRSMERKRLLSFWHGFEGDVHLVTCLHSGEPDGAESMPKYIGFGDARAVVEVSNALYECSTVNKPIRLKHDLDGDLFVKDSDNHLVCFGGGPSHRLTEELLTRLQVPRQFFGDCNGENNNIDIKYVCDIKGDYIEQPIIEDGEVIEDVGILVRAQHPDYPSRRVIIVAGAYSLGTWAGGHIASNEDILNHELIKPLLQKNDERFQVVFRARKRGIHIQPEILWVSKF